MKVWRHSYHLDGDYVSAVAVVIPTIPPRTGDLLPRALKSVFEQTLTPVEVHIVVDRNREGAPVIRQRALDLLSDRIRWVAFLDDDDFWYPNHLHTLVNLAQNNDAQVAYSWFDGNDPFPMHRGRQWDPQDPHHITMNILVDRRYAQFVGFRQDHPEGWDLPQEDWRFIVDLNSIGAKFAGTGEITWHYAVHGANTCGRPDRW